MAGETFWTGGDRKYKISASFNPQIF